MIQESDVLSVKQWFDLYVKQFCTDNERFNAAICLKVKHSKNVAAEVLNIANSLDLNKEACCLAEIIGMLHDIGRFEQFARYKTYSDRKSEDHARLGVEVITRTGVLCRFLTSEQKIVTDVILHHNRIDLPESDDSQFLLMLKLIRDADKIDILQVVTEHYLGIQTNEVIKMGLPDIPDVSDVIIDSIMNKQIAGYSDLKTINDFKLLQISWVFDLNFKKTCEIFVNRRYLEKLATTLPQTEKVKKAISVADHYLQSMC